MDFQVFRMVNSERFENYLDTTIYARKIRVKSFNKNLWTISAESAPIEFHQLVHYSDLTSLI